MLCFSRITISFSHEKIVYVIKNLQFTERSRQKHVMYCDDVIYLYRSTSICILKCADSYESNFR